MNIDIVFLAFAFASLAVFGFCKPANAVFIVFLGGWVLLPIGHFPPGGGDFPYWITGLAVPSDMLLTKAWIAPAAAFAGVLVFDRRTLRNWRPGWVDLPMLAWCAWPLFQATLSGPLSWQPSVSMSPSAARASLYLVGCWGLPWLLGRLYVTGAGGRLLLARGLALSALVCLPFSLIEGPLGPVLYGSVYGPQPFRFDGDVRYLGFRPMGFFEHGNQFGLWLALGSLAALWLALAAPRGTRALPAVIAAITLSMTLAAQSVGAVLLLGLGAGFLWACGRLRPRAMATAALLLFVAGGAVYVSGVVPVARIAKETSIGQRVVGSFRAVGRGSFTWRIAQDQKFIAQAAARPIAGAGVWDWWRPQGMRPWGLSILVLGQFGLVGMGLAFGALLWPALRRAWAAPRASGWRPEALGLMLATLVVLALVDALMNSFIYFPAILLAGGLASSAVGDDAAAGASA